MTDRVALSVAEAFELGRLNIHAQAQFRQAGDVSATELVEAVIQRIDALDPELGAICHCADMLVRRRAAAPLPAAPPALAALNA